MEFYSKKDLAMCGLACVLCSDEDCPGCKTRGCKEGSDCSVYNCATKKGIDGCYQCDEFPCGEKILQGMRNRAFNQYARQFGKEGLLERLHDNFEKGIAYHRADGHKGDYDILESEREIMQLIQFGRMDPYIDCPVLKTEHFILRLVTEDDSSDLLMCYSDEQARKIFNSDTCTSDFFYDTIQEMNDCIRMWINSYTQKEFVRFAIIDKSANHAVGTIEMFGNFGKSKTTRGILRLDIASKYEEEAYLHELFSLCTKELFALFAVDSIVTKAVPEALTRINALGRLGFETYAFPGREYYWAYKR